MDRVVLVGVLFLLAFTPMAIGSVHPWAFRIAETAAFLLFLVWMAKLLILLAGQEDAAPAIPGMLGRLALPLILVLSVMIFQLVPLPPKVLRIISPPTYRLYERCIRGWPIQVGYATDLGTLNDSTGSHQRPSPNRSPTVARWFGSNWRTLSSSPLLSQSSLLGGCAYIAFFLSVAFYPFSVGEQWIPRKIIAGVLVIGLLVASLGLIERVLWNGKILWFFIPLDWGTPRPEMARALGPFVDPDHFADYLGMIFPLAVGGLLFPWTFEGTTNSFGWRILCATVLVALTAAILLSLSRAVWAAIPLSMAVFWSMVSSVFELSPKVERDVRLSGRRRHWRRRVEDAIGAARRLVSHRWLVYAISLSVFTIVALALVGASARNEIDQRLGGTFQGDVFFGARLGLAKATLRMIAGFPLTGIGLGSWAELFPHFHSPPWTIYLIDHAHNDYVEFAAEIGMVCLAAVVWLSVRFFRDLISGAFRIQSSQWPMFVALICGALVVGLHELFDFSLHTPANAFLLCAILAIATRIAGSDGASSSIKAGKARIYAFASAGLLGAPILAFAATTQRATLLDLPSSLASSEEAVSQILSYPADAKSHLALASFEEGRNNPQATSEFEVAIWLDPQDPFIRDQYARHLFLAGRENDAIDQVRLSVMYSPDLGTHPYLTEQSIAFFSERERLGVEQGLKDAIRDRYPGSLDNLGQFFALTGRHVDEARLYSEAARAQHDYVEQERLHIAAAEAYFKAENSKAAVKELRAASDLVPSDARPYLELLSLVYGPSKDMRSAQSTVDEGIRNGVDPVQLYLALADAAQVAREPKTTEAALKEVVSYSPTFENNIRLGDFYLGSGNPDDAVEAMRRATMIQPDRADGYAYLAAAEEAAYQYVEADKNYAYAVSLEPNNQGLQSRYAAFRQKTADKSASLDP